MQGVGNSGKDTSHLLAIEYFGLRQDNGYANVLPPNCFLGRKRPGELDPALRECRRMRYIACNEIPQHDYFAFDALKPLVEQRGTGVATRTIYKRPEVWYPLGGMGLRSHPVS